MVWCPVAVLSACVSPDVSNERTSQSTENNAPPIASQAQDGHVTVGEAADEETGEWTMVSVGEFPQVRRRLRLRFRPLDEIELGKPVDIPPEKALDGRTRPDPVDVIYAVEMSEAKPSIVSAYQFSDGVRTKGLTFDKPGLEREPENKPLDPKIKVNPALLEQIKGLSPNKRVRAIVQFDSALVIPRFPEPPVGMDKAERREFEDRNAQIISKLIIERREEGNEKLLADTSAEIIERFWLTDSMLVELEVQDIFNLAEQPLVMSLDPVETKIEPPQDSNSSNDVDDARRIIRSDPYFNLGLSAGYIGLLDTGVDDRHEVFASPDNLDFLRDCVGGGANCNTGTIFTDDRWPHGTASGAIVSAGNGGGSEYRGVTDITLDSFRVYGGANGSRGLLNVAAAQRGFQQALRVGDRVILGEIQMVSNNSFDSLAVAADNAFNAGAVIVSAAGNNPGGGSSVSSPAIAHRSIAVGRMDLGDTTPFATSLTGPTEDNRIKPDVVAPSSSETARGSGNNSGVNDDNYGIFNGTSGAAPYGAGAAALLRNWLRRNSGTIDPGQVYAQLILSGNMGGPVGNFWGAGMINMPVNGWAWWGKTAVDTGDRIDIPLNVPEGANTLDAALWWADGRTPVSIPFITVTVDLTHDIDMELIDPRGRVRARSRLNDSVFERARVEGQIEPGQWRLRILGINTQLIEPNVYWAAHAER